MAKIAQSPVIISHSAFVSQISCLVTHRVRWGKTRTPTGNEMEKRSPFEQFNVP